jgi:hypothetical protein
VRRLHLRWLIVVGAVAIAVRVVAIDRLPGINGDEAWLGVNAQEIAAGGAPLLRTPVGNVLNPLHSGLLALFAAASPPSFVLLRVPAVLWGTLAVLLAYPLMAPALGARAALITASLLALSPVAVAQSRIGWDPSATPLLALVTLAFAASNRPVLAAAGGAAALIVHPTNIFLAPTVAALCARHALVRWPLPWMRGRTWPWLVAAIALLSAASAALPIARNLAHAGRLPSIELVVTRVTTPTTWFQSAQGLLAFFSGTTNALAIGGGLSVNERLLAESIGGLVLFVPLIAGWPRFRSAHGSLGPWLIGGLASSLLAFHVVGGPAMFHAPFERYLLFALVPLCVSCAVGIDSLWERWPRAGGFAHATAVALAAVVLATGYFVPLARGDAAHQTYHTGEHEPKAAAYRFLEEDSRDSLRVTVYAENWWLYWPLRYLAAGAADRIRVEMLDVAETRLFPPGRRPAPWPHPPERSYAVVFARSPLLPSLRERGAVAFTPVDPQDRPVLHVLRFPPSAAAH